MFEFKEIIINPESENSVKEILKNNEKEIQALLEDMTKNLGQGNTADIRFLEKESKFCFKIYKKPNMVPGDIFYLEPSQERKFLDTLRDIGTKVRVPRSYASFKVADSKDEDHEFLMMEALPAVSVDDVLQGRADLPKSFNFPEFMQNLREFVAQMHANSVYHRDLHEGNVMIDKETGDPYVIDFGAATFFYGEPEPGERGPYHVTKNGQTRKLSSDEYMIKEMSKRLSTLLTPVN